MKRAGMFFLIEGEMAAKQPEGGGTEARGASLLRRQVAATPPRRGAPTLPSRERE